MSSITAVCRTNNVNKKNKYSLYIRIIKNRRTRFISLDVRLLPDEWDELEKKVQPSHPNSARLNEYIAKKLSQAEHIALKLYSMDALAISSAIRKELMSKRYGSFSDYFNDYKDWLLKHNKIGSYIKIRSCIAKLIRFTENRPLSFEEIDVTFIKRYQEFLSSKLGNSINTVHGTIKVIRKLFNDAVREGILDTSQNPFLRYRLHTEPTTRAYLTEEEITRIEALELNSGSKMAQHRDLFVFACFACGLRVSDLLLLKWKDFDGTHLNLVIKKTGRQISIPLPNRALEILNSFSSSRSSSRSRIFPFLKRTRYTALGLNRAISSATAYLNKNLRKIATLAKIDKRISMGTSRHTWATRALRKGMRIEYVSKLLGHVNIRTTQLYTHIVDVELDVAMEIFND